ncbi:hypothetical protein BVG16_24590 [Paenibacillus selenitireducens]|jgi:hypothetical protein|uniref:Uncharacterized protein n=1 Tax=Paenibacillus selenitireducens TaxID=1324314 RepID=A0A1T2X3B2_9BACL|nr:hypothetical protein [Paenibacillus selenitireducens]OPA74305.1 hypothetical protein BVG16_24590 [Paenibacillus selenitireducens]
MSDQSRKAVQDMIQADFDSMNAATSASVGLTSMQYGRDDVQPAGDVISEASNSAAKVPASDTTNLFDDEYIN